MAGGESRRHAGGTQHRRITRIGGDNPRGGGVGWIGHQRLHRGGQRRHLHFGGLLEKRPGDVVELHGERVRLNAGERRRQCINGVVLARHAGMSPAVQHGERVVGVDLLRGLNGVEQRFVVLQGAAAAFVDGVLGVNQLTMIGNQPTHAVVAAPFFIGGERKDEIALRHPAFLLISQQVGGQDGGHGLVVGNTAPQEVAVLLRHGKRVAWPVAAVGRDHVEMGQEQDRLPASFPAVAHDQILLRGRVGWAKEVDICGREPRCRKAGCNGLGRFRHRSHGVHRVDLNHLPVNLAGLLLRRRQGGRSARGLLQDLRGERRRNGEREQEGHHTHMGRHRRTQVRTGEGRAVATRERHGRGAPGAKTEGGGCGGSYREIGGAWVGGGGRQQDGCPSRSFPPTLVPSGHALGGLSASSPPCS